MTSVRLVLTGAATVAALGSAGWSGSMAPGSAAAQQATGQQATGQQATGQQATGQQATGQQATGQQSPPAFAGYVELPGVRLWYTDSGGSGVPVVLMHANTGNADIWEPNLPAFLAAGCRVITFDRRGWGRSITNPETGPQPSTQADDLHALVEHLGLDRFHLVGVAGGGYVAYDYVLWRPERLRSLVVAASGGGIQDEGLREIRARTRLPGFSEWPPELREVSIGYVATNTEGLERWLGIHHHSRQPGAPEQGQRNAVTHARLETIAVPTLLLAGDQDLTTPTWVIREQARHIPGVEFHIIPEVGHAISWEQPDVFNNYVLEFLARH
jgi:pimeloyl-ACP methyl ester carboxylesterase